MFYPDGTPNEDLYIRVTMDDGSKWDVPISFIIDHKVEFEKSCIGDKGCSRDELILMLGEDGGENVLMDYAKKYMTWDDVIGVAIKVEARFVSYQKCWCDGDHEIVKGDYE